MSKTFQERRENEAGLLEEDALYEPWDKKEEGKGWPGQPEQADSDE